MIYGPYRPDRVCNIKHQRTRGREQAAGFVSTGRFNSCIVIQVELGHIKVYDKMEVICIFL